MKSAGDEMIRLAVAIGFVCGGCNRSEAGVVQNAHGDAKPPKIFSPLKEIYKYSSWVFFQDCNMGCSRRGRWGLDFLFLGGGGFHTSGV